MCRNKKLLFNLSEMATRILFISAIIYLITVIFSIYQLPGTLELGIFSIPTVSLLLFRYYRVNFKCEKNLVIKYFSLMMSVFISLSFLIPIFFYEGNHFPGLNEFQMISWIMLILFNIVYYLYFSIFSHGKKNKFGYLILIFVSILFLIETMISYTLSDYMELKYITYTSLIILSVYVYFQFLWNKPLPKINLGQTLLIGAILMYVIDICYLVLQ